MNKPRNYRYLKGIILASLVLVFLGFLLLDIQSLFTLQTLKLYHAELQLNINQYPIESALLFISIYMISTGLSLPVAGILSLSSGAFFGLLWGTILSSTGGIIGSTTAFLLSRYLFRELVQGKYSERLLTINKGIEKDGAIYLLSLRLFPIIPYFILNLVMGVTPIRTLTYIIVSIVGMLPVTFIFVNAGTQLQRINSMDDIMSPSLIAALMLLAIFILVGHRIAANIKRKYENTFSE